MSVSGKEEEGKGEIKKLTCYGEPQKEKLKGGD